MEVEVILDYPVEENQEQFVYLWIQSLAASDGTATPSFRDSLGPVPPPPSEDFTTSAPASPDFSPASPDPYGDEDSSDESLISVASIDPLRWEEEEMSTGEDMDTANADWDSPRSPIPEPLPYDEALGYYLTYYQWSLLLVNTTREP